MSLLTIASETLVNIANAIRAKTGRTATMTPAQMVTEIRSIPTGGGGGTLRTTHFHGTLSYSNQAVYNPIIPVTGVLSTDVILVVLKLKRTGTVSDGVTTWNDELIVPDAFNDTSIKLWVTSRTSINLGVLNIKGTDGTTQNTFSIMPDGIRAVYANSYGNEVNIQNVSIDENGITLTQQGWNTRVCTSGVATEYEYDVYIMAEDGNAIVNGG